MFFTKNANNEVYLEKAGGDLSKSKLRTGYIIVPLGVQYNFSKLKNAGMDVQYRRFYKGFKIGANVYGGVRMSTNNIIEGNDGELRNRENYQVNPLFMELSLRFLQQFKCFVKKISVTSKTVL
jgi:hypothetical protein